MKHIYLSLFLLFLSFGFYSQKPSYEHRPMRIDGATSTKPIIKKAVPGDVFWYEDFANGIGGNAVDGSGTPIGGDIFWTRGYIGATDYSYIWQHDFDGPNGEFESGGPLLSESSSNGFMIYDADKQWAIEHGGTYNFSTYEGYLESPTIDISSFGTTTIGLEIQHLFRTCCGDSTLSDVYPVDIFIGYFDNGTSVWKWIEKNSGNDSHNSYNVSGTLNGGPWYIPEIMMINISDVANMAAVNTNEIKVRFHWNSELGNKNSFYVWMIDDVRVKEIYAYDSEVNNIFTGDIINDFEYYAIPHSQITNYTTVVGAQISNEGAYNLTDAHVDVEITNPSLSTAYSGSSSVQNLATAQQIEVWFDTGFTPTPWEFGEYIVTVTSAHNETDSNPSNNTLTKKFAYTHEEMGHYNPNGNLTVDVVNSGSDPGRVMQLYQIYEDATIYGIAFYLKNSTTTNTIGQTAYVGIYDVWDGQTAIYKKDFEVTEEMIDMVYVICIDEFEVKKGDMFYAGLGSYGGGNDLVVAKDYNMDYDNSALVDNNGFLSGALGEAYVNLWFEWWTSCYSSTDNFEKNSFKLFPSPTASEVNIESEQPITSVELRDISGKLVLESTSHTIDVSNLSEGIYYVKVEFYNGNNAYEKLIKQ